MKIFVSSKALSVKISPNRLPLSHAGAKTMARMFRVGVWK